MSSFQDWWDLFVAYCVPRFVLRIQRRLRYGPWFHRATDARDYCPVCKEADERERNKEGIM